MLSGSDWRGTHSLHTNPAIWPFTYYSTDGLPRSSRHSTGCFSSQQAGEVEMQPGCVCYSIDCSLKESLSQQRVMCSQREQTIIQSNQWFSKQLLKVESQHCSLLWLIYQTHIMEYVFICDKCVSTYTNDQIANTNTKITFNTK